ncbi:MAG: Tim44 domain-containing protein [Deltaproteobacteria bacterium]|nr:Tim44 domain-containing protein [Deltaproteobacteria bacterium]
MIGATWRKTGLVVLAALFFCTWVFLSEALAQRAGGGRSMGSRGSRTYSPPKTYTPSPTKPSQPSYTPPATQAPGSRPLASPAQGTGSFWRSFGGGMLGGLAGGFLYRSLFGGSPATATSGAGGTAGSSGSSFGLLDILILGGIAFAIYYFIKSRRQEAVAAGPSQYSAQSMQAPQPNAPPYYDQQSQPMGDQDLERGLQFIRQMDPSFDETRFRDQAMDIFFKVQGAWADRDMTPARSILSEEMFRLLQEDAARLRQEGKVNKLESVAVRSVDLTEAWQEQGQDYLTARILASLLDYTVDAKTGAVLEGSKTDPVKFEEYWTFTRPVGSNPWQLSAITQSPT